jgi:hypothetical protein
MRDVRIEEGDVASRESTDGELDGSAELRRRRRDAFQRGNSVGCGERSGATARREGELGVTADDSDLLALDGGGSKGEEVVVILEEDDGGRGGYSKECSNFRSVDLVFFGFEGNAASRGVVDEVE